MKPELIALFSNLDPVTIGLLITLGVAMVVWITVGFWLIVIRGSQDRQENSGRT